VGIKAAVGEYIMLTAVDQLFSPSVLARVYKLVSPNRVVQSNRADLPLNFDLGEADTISERWDSLMAQAIPPTKFAIGAIVCTTREWLHKVHGLDEVRTPYNYCDSDLLERAQIDGLQAVDIGWGDAQVLHISHPRNNPLYYGCGGHLPDNKLPIVRNLEGWGNVAL
jgi:GT2 family glycosyltransferase